ncbi:MAG: hypothetical protein PF448_07365 [Bacteroidales bacterium]|nr:hypothetical protein [Bacteroidales bacterium]
MTRQILGISFILLILLVSCKKPADIFSVSIMNDREDTIFVEKYFATNGVSHEIAVMPKQSQFMFQKEGEWRGVEVENRLRYDSLIFIVDSLRIFISADSSSYFQPNPFQSVNAWQERDEIDEDGNDKAIFYLRIPEDSVLMR